MGGLCSGCSQERGVRHWSRKANRLGIDYEWTSNGDVELQEAEVGWILKGTAVRQQPLVDAKEIDGPSFATVTMLARATKDGMALLGSQVSRSSPRRGDLHTRFRFLRTAQIGCPTRVARRNEYCAVSSRR